MAGGGVDNGSHHWDCYTLGSTVRNSASTTVVAVDMLMWTEVVRILPSSVCEKWRCAGLQAPHQKAPNRRPEITRRVFICQKRRSQVSFSCSEPGFRPLQHWQPGRRRTIACFTLRHLSSFRQVDAPVLCILHLVRNLGLVR